MNTTWMWTVWGAMGGGVVLYGWVWQRAGRRGRIWLEWGLAVLVAGVSLASAVTHEPWRDELHSWLQAREMGLGALWKEMAYEGHFLSWHLLLWPMAHSGAPVWTMEAMSWLLNAAVVWWLARHSPLTGWEKAVAGASCLFLYVNPVVSRCYVLVPVAMFGLASLWGKRDERPVGFGLWVALLANTHVFMAGTAAAVFAVYAWENVLRRADGKGCLECGRQLAGLGVMAAGGALALAQGLPGIWKSSVAMGRGLAVAAGGGLVFQDCVPVVGRVAVATGAVWLCVELWRRERGWFWVAAASWGYMLAFAAFVFPAFVVNRALSWWPVMLAGAWVLAGREGGGAAWFQAGRVVAVVAMGLGVMRPDMTWKDWQGDYDALPSACRWIADRYGADAEVWINGWDCCCEGAAAYLSNLRDWRTGERARPIRFSMAEAKETPSFAECRGRIFAEDPEREDFLALVSDWRDTCGLTTEDLMLPGLVAERVWEAGSVRWGAKNGLLRVRRRGKEWMSTGVARYSKGDRSGAEAAWKRAVAEDGNAWEAMNNLAWLALEDGRIAEARAWIDRAMAHEEARENGSARDTAAAVAKAERLAAVTSE